MVYVKKQNKQTKIKKKKKQTNQKTKQQKNPNKTSRHQLKEIVISSFILSYKLSYYFDKLHIIVTGSF